MKEKEGGREEIQDHYQGHEVDMKTAVPHNSILEEGAKNSPAMTGESKEEVDYTNPPDKNPND